MLRQHVTFCALGSLVAMGWGCQPSPSRFGPGLDLQVRVAGAQLLRGELPEDAGGPAVSQVLRPQPSVRRGDATVKINGRLAPSGIALHLHAIGDEDHWVISPKGFDFVITNELLWDAQLEFSYAIPNDRVTLQLQAADEQGRVGPIEQVGFTVLSDVAPSRLLISLGWDSPVDLDLYVELPNGVVVGPKNVNSQEPIPGQTPSPDAWMEGGIYDFDSNQQCNLDLRNRENVVWTQSPPPGLYRVYAHLFSPCDQAAVNLEVMVARDDEVIEQVGSTLHAFDSRQHPSDDEAPGLLMVEFEVE